MSKRKPISDVRWRVPIGYLGDECRQFRATGCLVVLGLLAVVNVARESFGDSPTPADVGGDLAKPSTFWPDLDADKKVVEAARLQAGELSRRAGEEVVALRKAAYHLASANAVLSHELEPAASNGLLTLYSEIEASTVADVQDALSRADQSIELGLAALVSIQNGEAVVSEEIRTEVERLEEAGRSLKVFANAMRTYLDSGAVDTDQVRDRASELSFFRENADPKVAGAARLWQSALRSRESDSQPVLWNLEYVFSAPAVASLPYSFHGRILRCRIVASRGAESSALALLHQLEEQCDEWFADPELRAAARRTCAFLRLEILQSWRDRLAEGNADERTWCGEQMELLSKDYFQGSRRTLYRLSPAVPIFVPPPQENSPQPTANPG